MLGRDLAYIVRSRSDNGSGLPLNVACRRWIGDLRNDASKDTAVNGPHISNELDEVVLARAASVAELGKELPAGARGTVVGVWQGGRAYEVEFAEPFACVITVPAEDLAA